MSRSVCRFSVWSGVVAVLGVAGAASVTRAAVAPPGSDSFAASPLVVARADLPPATETAFLRLYYPADQLVEAPTRHPKPLSQIAENVTVITAQEIEDMNAHTLAEVLARLPGLYPQFLANHLGAIMLPHLQGSGETQWHRDGVDERHVTVLVDGMPWNSATCGPYLNTIPVGIVERIEVIKGPASSTWGGALAGVINVITKAPGSRGGPGGAVSAAAGEGMTDGRGELAGAAGPVGYYLQVQDQRADWAEDNGSYVGRAGFAKTAVPLGPAATLTVSGGKSRAEIQNMPFSALGVLSDTDVRATFGRAALDVQPGGRVGFHLAAYAYDEFITQPTREDGSGVLDALLGLPLAPGQTVFEDTWDEEHRGVQGRAVVTAGAHSVVVGADYAHTALEEIHFTDFGGPDTQTPDRATVSRFGLYANDTWVLGPAAVSPGIRYDRNSVLGGFLSPSLGATLRLGKTTVLRGLVARGFTEPPLSWFAGGSYATDPNPDLKPEQVWSYQAGVETAVLRLVWLKATLFRHEVKDSLEEEDFDVPAGWRFVNSGHSWRTGFEVEGETAPLAGFTLRSSFSYVRVKKEARADKVSPNQKLYAGTAGAYWRGAGWQAQLVGSYVWWDLAPNVAGESAEEGEWNDPLWDLALSKTLPIVRTVDATVFFSAHNLFNGTTSLEPEETAPRWLEAGLRVRF